MHFDGCSFSLVAAKQTHVLSAAYTRTSCIQVLGEKKSMSLFYLRIFKPQ